MAQFKVAGIVYEAPTRAAAENMHAEALRRAKEVPLPLYREGRCQIMASYALSKQSVSPVTKWGDIPMDKRAKLLKAVGVAPIMVREALKQLNAHLARTVPGDNDPDLDMTPVGIAMLKYLNIEVATPDYANLVRGIISVLGKVRDGFAGAFTIVIGSFGARGRVEGLQSGDVPVSPIRATFGFVDEWGHKRYTGHVQYGDIELAHGYVIDTLEAFTVTSFDGIARTIVHEGSHKWAFTKDVLYKKDSFFKSDNPLDQAELARNAQTIPGRDKKLRPMMGREKGSADIIPPQRWLENADSYAWLTRRLWKKAGQPEA